MKLDKLIKLQKCILIYKLENHHMHHMLKRVQNITNRETRQKKIILPNIYTATTENRRKNPIYASTTTFNGMTGHIENFVNCTISNFQNLILSQV